MSGTPGVEDSLREATREARAALKDLKAERKEIEALIAGAADRIDEQVRKGLEEYFETIKQAQRDATDKVFREFDKLKNAFLTGNLRGRGEHLADLATDAREVEPWPKP